MQFYLSHKVCVSVMTILYMQCHESSKLQLDSLKKIK